MLPTPDAYNGTRGGAQDPAKRLAGGHAVSLQDAVSVLLPTPTTADRMQDSAARTGGPSLSVVATQLTGASTDQPSDAESTSPDAPLPLRLF